MAISIENESFTVDFIGVGAPRCGTSWLFRCLSEHPEICFSSPKETHFFDNNDNFKKGYSHYAEFFDHCEKTAKILGEFTPTYFLHEHIGEEIRKKFPDAKILVSLRDPVERTLSNIQYYTKRTGQTVNLEDDIRNRQNKRLYLYASFYHRYLSAFLQHFDKSQVKILILEEVKADPAAAMEDLFAFLGVDSSFVPENLYTERNTSSHIVYRYRAINTLIDFRVPLKSHPIGKWFVKLLHFFKLNLITRKIAKFNNKGGYDNSVRESISESQRRDLHKLFLSDIEALEQMLGRDLQIWKTPYHN